MWTTSLCAISHVANHVCTKHQKIPEKSKLMIEFPISPHYKNLNQKIMLKVDMGSDINCISLGTFHKLFPHQQLTKSMLLLENYSNSSVSIIGKFKAFIWWKGNSIPPRISCYKCKFITQSSIQRCFYFEWKYYRLVSLLLEKRFHHEQNKVIAVLNQVWANHHIQCLPLFWRVWAS